MHKHIVVFRIFNYIESNININHTGKFLVSLRPQYLIDSMLEEDNYSTIGHMELEEATPPKLQPLKE